MTSTSTALSFGVATRDDDEHRVLECFFALFCGASFFERFLRLAVALSVLTITRIDILG